MKRLFYILFFFLIAGTLWTTFDVHKKGFFSEQNVSAQEVTDDEIDDLEDKIKEYEKKIEELEGRQKSLSNEIQYMDSQINLTLLRIQNSQAKIDSTTKEISKLSGNISDIKERLQKMIVSIDHQQDVLNARVRARYKVQETSPTIIFFGSTTINTMIKRSEYLKVMEIQDNKLLDQMEQAKNAYDKQRTLFEEKKEETEQLKLSLEAEKANLDRYKGTLEGQREEKNNLLRVTQNDEEKYQELLEEARKELEQIVGAVSVLKYQDGEKVKKGDRIGTQGNTGFSSGDHLHFGVYKYSSFADIEGWNWYYSNYVDPSKVLKSKNVYWDTGCESAGFRDTGKGDWSWPMSSPTISQGFGHTCWSNVYYGGKVHPAYDMYGAYGAAVYAVDDGEAYFCRNCLGDGGNGVFIFHDDKYMTVYWHLR